MHASHVIRILNVVLKRIDPAIQLPSDTDESQIEPNINSMLSLYDKLARINGRDTRHDPDNPPHFELRLAKLQGRKPASGAKVKGFVSALTACGVPLQAAFDQACRLNVGGGTNDR